MRNFRLLVFILVIACFQACSGTRIKGILNGAPESELIIKALDVNKYITLDTIKTSAKGSYSYKADIPKGQPEFIYLFYKNTRVASLIVERGDKLKVISDTLGNYSVTGSPETNKLIEVERDEAEFLNKFASLNAKIEDLPENSEESIALRREAAKNYISYYRSRVRYIMKNPYSLTIIPVLYQTVGSVPVFGQITDAIHFRNASDSLKTVYPNSKYVKALSEEADRRSNLLRLSSKIETAKESAFPDIELPDISGKKVKLSSLKSKMVMLYFWAAASSGQNMFNFNVLKPLYNNYSSKGFEIYAVSLDTDKTAWANIVRNQNLPWVNVCDGLGVNSTAVSLYNVSKVPMVYFIKDGELLPDVGVRDEKSLVKYIESVLK